MIVEKPWGHEFIWAKTKDYVGKLLVIKPHKRLSLQSHVEKEETLLVLSGTITASYGVCKDSLIDIVLNKNDTIHINPGMLHRFTAHDEEVILAEVSTPQLDDVIRYVDDYGRVSAKGSKNGKEGN